MGYKKDGDRSIAYWRTAHENYFRRNHFENPAFDEQMLIVCEKGRNRIEIEVDIVHNTEKYNMTESRDRRISGWQ